MRVNVSARTPKREKAARCMQKLLNWYLKKIERDYPEKDQYLDMVLYGTINAKRFHEASQRVMKEVS